MHNTASAFFPQQQPRNEDKDAASTGRQPATNSQISSQGSGLLCGAARGSAVQSSSLAGGRGLRFPSSRRYLWDRTPAGPQVLINTQDHVPRVQVAISAFSAISRAAERQTAAVPLQLGISVTLTNQVTALVQELDPLVCKAAAGDLMQLTCPLQQMEARQDTIPKLRSALQAQVDQRNSARVQQLYAFSAAAAPAAALGERCCLQLQLLMPSCSFMATPLYAKRLCQVPLAEALLKPGGMSAWQSGYLSMDQARSLLPLEATDPSVYSTPLVGVWVKGPSSVMHPLVALACLRFAYTSLLADRAVNPSSGAFLLLLCSEGDPVSKCFEVCLSDLNSLQLGSYQYTAALHSGASIAQYPGGLVKAECHVSNSKPDPLPGSRIAPAAAATSGGSSGTGVRESLAAAAAATPTRCSAAYNGASHVPQLGIGDDSPVLMAGHYSSSCYSISRGLALPAARSSAPTGDYSTRCIAQQYAAAADARRSLPLTVETATPSGVHTLAGSTVNRLSSSAAAVRMAETDDAALPQPRSRVPTGPYSSPQVQHYKSAAAAGGLHSWQQNQQMQKQVAPVHVASAQEHQQWVSLGEQLLAEPSAAAAGAGGIQQEQQQWAKLGEQLLLEPAAADNTQLKDTDSVAAAAAAANERTGTPGTQEYKISEQQQRAERAETDASRLGSPLCRHKQQQVVGRVACDSDTRVAHEVAPVPPSMQADVALSHLAWLQGLSTKQLPAPIANVMSPTKTPQQQHDQQQRQTAAGSVGDGRHTCNPVAASDVYADVSVATGDSSPWAAHDVTCVSPSVRAGVALSHLALLQQLSTGQLQTAIDKVVSPTKAGQQQQFQQQQQHVNRQQQGPCDVVDGSSNVLQQKKQFCTTASPAVALNSTAVGSDVFGVESGLVSAAQCEAQHGAGTNAAAAALEAAAAAVQCMPPSPDRRNLGVQRYAADVAALCDSSRNSQECSVAVAGAWAATGQPGWDARSPTAAAAAAVSPTARKTLPVGLNGTLRGSYPSSPCSSCLRRNAAAGVGDSQQVQQQLHSSLDWSAAAVASTAAALDAAGQLLHPWNAPESVMSHQQVLQQHQQEQVGSRVLAPAWQDPVAQALQGEVEQLRQELAKLQRQLRMAGMPDVTALALPPLEPDAAPAVPAAQAPVQAPAATSAAAQQAAVAAPTAPAAAATPAVAQPMAALAGGLCAEVALVPPPAVPAATTAAAGVVAADDQAVRQRSQQAASQSVTAAAAAQRAADGTALAATSNQPNATADVAAVTAVQPDVAAGTALQSGNSSDVAETRSSNHNSSASCTGGSRQLTANASGVIPGGGEGNTAGLHDIVDDGAESSTASKFFSPAKQLQPCAAPAGSSSTTQRAAAAAARSRALALPTQSSAASPVKSTGIPAAIETSSPDRYGKPSRSGAAAAAVYHSDAAATSLRASGGQLKTCLDVAPLVEVVRTKYCQLSDDSDDSDQEFEEKLMLKYGLKQH